MGFFDSVAVMDGQAIQLLGSVDVTYTPTVGSPIVVQGLFDDGYELLVELDAEYAVEQASPRVFVLVADLPADYATDDPTLTINGQAYSIIRREHDAKRAGIMLVLHAVL